MKRCFKTRILIIRENGIMFNRQHSILGVQCSTIIFYLTPDMKRHWNRQD